MKVCLLLLCLLSACRPFGGKSPPLPVDRQQSDTTTGADALPRTGRLLSAFFGLDNRMPAAADLGLCPGAGGADGIAVVFSTELDPASLQAGDLRVLTRTGRSLTPSCVTLMPANDPGERRTALLVGDLGNHPADAPLRVQVVGHVLSQDRQSSFVGADLAVTPLPDGPSLVLAESADTQGCPAETAQALRVVWSGGVRRPDGNEAGEAERLLYAVTLADTPTPVTPLALADLGDGDNNYVLCLDVAGRPARVGFAAGGLEDPNGDVNGETSVAIL